MLCCSGAAQGLAVTEPPVLCCAVLCCSGAAQGLAVPSEDNQRTYMTSVMSRVMTSRMELYWFYPYDLDFAANAWEQSWGFYKGDRITLKNGSATTLNSLKQGEQLSVQPRAG
jgi:hypothetical protein